MLISATGYRRNMGPNMLNKKTDISDIEIKRNSYPYADFNRIQAVSSDNGVSLHWVKTLLLNGDYHISVELSRSDIAALFKACFGEELSPAATTEAGIRLSKELQKEVCLGLTLKDLLGPLQESA